MTLHAIEILDTHTGGEPTRVVLSGGPDLGSGPLSERRQRFAEQFDHFRSAIINEPRGSDVIVGALLVPPVDPACATGVIFFNNVGMIGMCGHGTIGVTVALSHLGKLGPGLHRFESVVGDVSVDYAGGPEVTIHNVLSYRHAAGVAVEVPGYGRVVGDIAWAGNWFFLVEEHRETLTFDQVERLTDVTWKIRQALEANHITGADGGVIDHIELVGPPADVNHQARNFVLCPGKAYDRSPCGTGTSAKLACLAAAGKLQPGQVWRQESIVGSVFAGRYQWLDNHRIRPTITGSAYVTGRATLLIDPADPFAWGIRG